MVVVVVVVVLIVVLVMVVIVGCIDVVVLQASLHPSQTLLLAPGPSQLGWRSHRPRLLHLQPGLHLQGKCDLLGKTLNLSLHFFIWFL